MSVTESRRLALFDHARTAWGEDVATTLMDLLPPDPDQLATKADLALLRVDLSQAQADLRVEMSELRTELRGEMSYLRVDVKQEIAGLTRTYVLSSVGTVLTIVLAVGVLR